jgi:hypothetical protein
MGGVTIHMIVASSWAAVRREDNDLYHWEEVPKEKTPEGPNDGGNPGSDDDGRDTAMSTLSGCISYVVWLAVTPSRSSTHRSVNVSRPWRQ